MLTVPSGRSSTANLSGASSSADGSPAPFYRMAELYYDSREALAEGQRTPQSKGAREQVLEWRWRDVNFIFGEEIEQEVGA